MKKILENRAPGLGAFLIPLPSPVEFLAWLIQPHITDILGEMCSIRALCAWGFIWMRTSHQDIWHWVLDWDQVPKVMTRRGGFPGARSGTGSLPVTNRNGHSERYNVDVRTGLYSNTLPNTKVWRINNSQHMLTRSESVHSIPCAQFSSFKSHMNWRKLKCKILDRAKSRPFPP